MTCIKKPYRKSLVRGDFWLQEVLSVYSDGVVSWDNFLPQVNAEIHKLIEASGKVTLDQKLIPAYFMDLPIRNCVAIK